MYLERVKSQKPQKGGFGLFVWSTVYEMLDGLWIVPNFIAQSPTFVLHILHILCICSGVEKTIKCAIIFVG